MSKHFGITSRLGARRAVLAVTGLLAISGAAAGCNADSNGRASAGGTAVAPSASSSPATSAASVTSNLPGKRPVPVDKVVTLHAQHGHLGNVAVRIGKGDQTLTGTLSADKRTWTSTQRLEPGVRYAVHAVAVDAQGLKAKKRQVFRTQDLTLDQQTYPSFAPLAGETVGVGMPVIVHFDVPVTDKAAIEKHLSVQTSPHQAGAWHWISGNEVHWRPAHYWKPGTDVTVNADINSIPAGNGIYGQLSRSSSFHVGDAIIAKVNIKAHQMRVFVNGKLERTIPISAGKPGFTTRSGIKVIVEKFRHKRMDARTINIKPGSPNYYNLSNVEYAQRVTYSGEFLHAAPWSVSEQGSSNVSHGCVGMSTANAAWFYHLTHGRGDVVAVTGSNRHMTLTNGYGDWNESFSQYAQGSALH
ncbi:MAG: L,D-transpeptidase [Nocardioidaceae bacterium]